MNLDSFFKILIILSMTLALLIIVASSILFLIAQKRRAKNDKEDEKKYYALEKANAQLQKAMNILLSISILIIFTSGMAVIIYPHESYGIMKLKLIIMAADYLLFASLCSILILSKSLSCLASRTK